MQKPVIQHHGCHSYKSGIKPPNANNYNQFTIKYSNSNERGTWRTSERSTAICESGVWEVARDVSRPAMSSGCRSTQSWRCSPGRVGAARPAIMVQTDFIIQLFASFFFAGTLASPAAAVGNKRVRKSSIKTWSESDDLESGCVVDWWNSMVTGL